MASKIYLFLFLFVLPAFAGQELIVREELRVYEKRSKSSNLLKELQVGDRVPVSTRNYGSWKKVIVEYRGQQSFGFIPRSSIKKSRISTVDLSRRSKKRSRIYHLNSSIGIALTFSSVSVGENDLATDDGNSILLDTLTGSSFFFGFLYDYNWTDHRMLRLFLNLREHDLEGEGRFNSQSAAQNDITMSQSFLSFGALVKFYGSKDSNFWWGLGVELANGSNVDLSFNDVQTEVSGDGLPFYAFLSLPIGYDFNLGSGFGITPDIRLNYAVNSDNLVYAIEFTLATTYQF